MKQTILVLSVIIAGLTACSPLEPIPSIPPVSTEGENIITPDNASTLVNLTNVSQGDMGNATALAFNANNTRISVVHAHNTPMLRTWNISDKSLFAEYELKTVGLGAVAFNRDGTLIAMAGADESQIFGDDYLVGVTPEQFMGPMDGIYLINAENGELLDYIPASGNWLEFHGVSLNQDGSVITTQGRGRTNHASEAIVFLRSGSQTASPIFSVEHETNLFNMDSALDSEGRLLAVYDAEDGSIQLWDLKSKESWGKLKPSKKQADAETENTGGILAIAPTRQWLASFSMTENLSNLRYITLWNLNERQIKWRSEIKAPYIHAFAFNPQGDLLAAGETDGVHLWDVASGEEVKTFSGESVFSVAFSQDGSLFAWGDKAGVVHLAELEKR